MNILEKVYICNKYYSHKTNNNDAELCLDLDKLKGTTALGSCWLYYSINDSKKELTDIKNQLALYIWLYSRCCQNVSGDGVIIAQNRIGTGFLGFAHYSHSMVLGGLEEIS